MSDSVAHPVSPDDAPFIESTRCWIEKVVIGENFCPFARRVMEQDAIRFVVCHEAEPVEVLQSLMAEIRQLDTRPDIETGLLILPRGFADFDAYLDLAALAEQLLIEQGYEGVYQLASFHPDYRFADSAAVDAADYTNRSPWPMLHLLREASLERALIGYPDPESIPQRNIEHARARGAAALRTLRDACLAPSKKNHEH
ncbi:MAG: DUF1415 domain-containing protein [Alphaproteobacteria bacterium]